MTVKLADLKVIVMGSNSWGKGDTVEEARARAEEHGGKLKKWVAYLVHPSAYITDMGDMRWSDGGDDYQPKLISQRGA